MRSMLFLGILALGGCDALWSWRLTDCRDSRGGCPSGDMSVDLSIGENADLAGADLYGTTPIPDLATTPPGYTSIATHFYNSSFDNVLIGSTDNKLALYAYPNTSVTSSYSVTSNFATPILGVSDVRIPGAFPPSLDRAFLAMTGDGRLLTRPDTPQAAPFTQVHSAGQSLNALWMSTPDNNPGGGVSYGWAVGQAGTVVSINYSNGTPTISTKQETAAASANLLGVDGVDSMVVVGFDMGTGNLGQAWAVGSGGVIIERMGTTWRRIGSTDFAGATPPTSTLYSVSHASDGTILAVGAGGTSIQRGLDTVWASKSTGVTTTLYGVAANSATDGIAVGANGTILRLSGSGWAPENASAFPNGKPTGTLRAIHCFYSSNCWVVGDGTALWRWDGGAWNKVLN